MFFFGKFHCERSLFSQSFTCARNNSIIPTCNNSASERNASLLASFTVSAAYFRKVLLALASKTLQISIFFFKPQACFAQINSKCAIIQPKQPVLANIFNTFLHYQAKICVNFCEDNYSAKKMNAEAFIFLLITRNVTCT